MKHVFAPGRASALTIMGSFPGCQAVAENKQPCCVPSAQMPAPCVTSGLDGGQCTLRGPPGTPIRFNPLGTKRCQRSLAPCRSLSSAGVLTVVGFILSSDLEKARLSFFLSFIVFVPGVFLPQHPLVSSWPWQLPGRVAGWISIQFF